MFPTEHDREISRWWSTGGDEKFRYDYELNSDSFVIDLGGYKGQWASDIYSRYNCRLLIFEPVKVFAEKIKERFRRNPKIEVYCLGLGKNRRKDVIFLDDDGSSTHKNSKKREAIEIEDAVEFFEKKKIMNVDLMKVNIEGGEYELMPRLLESGLVKRIKNIQIQFHYIGQESDVYMREICKELEKTHTPTYQYKYVWENWVRRDG
jgi:FkbM family methyltransferase